MQSWVDRLTDVVEDETAVVTTVRSRGFHRLWWLAIVGIIAMVGAIALAWTSMPEPIAVQWSTDGRVTNTMSKLAWILVWCGAWAFPSSALAALRGPFDWRRALVIVVLGVLAAGFVTTLENNLGAATWRDAEPLELFPAAAIAVAAAAAVWISDRLLDR